MEAARKVQETYHRTGCCRARQAPGRRLGRAPGYVAPREVVSRSRQAWETGAHSDAVNLRRQSPARSRTSPRLRHTARRVLPQDIGRGGRVEGRTPREPRRHHLVVHDPAAPHGPAGRASGVRGRAGPLLPFLPSRASVRAPRRDRRAGVLRAERVPHHRHSAPVPGAPRRRPGAGRIGAAALLHPPHPADLPAVLLRADDRVARQGVGRPARASRGTRPISPTCASFWTMRCTTANGAAGSATSGRSRWRNSSISCGPGSSSSHLAAGCRESRLAPPPSARSSGSSSTASPATTSRRSCSPAASTPWRSGPTWP